MINNFDYIEFINDIIYFSPRQWKNEQKTADFLKHFLEKNSIIFDIHRFLTATVLEKECFLKADNSYIDCISSCYISGEINSKDNLISSMFPSKDLLYYENINFNPNCLLSISLWNHFFAPSISINPKDITKVLNAKNIYWKVNVQKFEYEAENILVWNTNNPKTITFAHYDSVQTWAIDNASWVSVMMWFILENPDYLKDNLFVFAANEELSYDQPFYFGRWFRQFEKDNFDILNNASKIISIDSVWNWEPLVITDPQWSHLALAFDNFNNLKEKIQVISWNIPHLMSVYHSDIDDGRGIKLDFLISTKNKYEEILNL